MNNILGNSENSKTWDLSDKINLKRSDKCVALSSLSIYYAYRNKKCHTKVLNLRYQLQRAMLNLNYLWLTIYPRLFWVYHQKTWISDW